MHIYQDAVILNIHSCNFLYTRSEYVVCQILYSYMHWYSVVASYTYQIILSKLLKT